MEKVEAPVGTPVKLGSAAPKVATTKQNTVAKANPKVEVARSTYQVKDGDTLWDIARKHKVSISEIQQWNNLTDPSEVKPGMKLSIQRN